MNIEIRWLGFKGVSKLKEEKLTSHKTKDPDVFAKASCRPGIPNPYNNY